MAKSKNKKALGRGLSALLNDDDDEAINNTSKINEIEIENIIINPFQPRTYFNEELIKELQNSIKELGLIQPITVRETVNNKFQLISGERRYRAVKSLGLKKIVAYIRKANDQELLEMALVENIQREDLDPIEIALSYQRLIDEVKLTQNELSERVGKKRSTISNYIRLLKLDPLIQTGIRDRFLSMGHGRALINIENNSVQLEIYKKIISKGLSVRETENIVQNLKELKKKNTPKHQSEYITQVALSLEKLFDNVVIKSDSSGKGFIKIEFGSQQNLENIINKIKGA
jgi:ParB family chromosome partitioning protein